MKRFCFYLLVPLLLFFSGCAPTYPKEKITSSIVKMCQDKHGLPVIAKISENTLGVYMAIDNLLGQNLSLTQETSEKIGNVMLIIHRAVLSTDGNIEFYTLTVADKKLPSAEFNLTVYVKDIKRALTLDISRSEYYQRISRDLKLNLSSLVTADTFSVKPIKVSDFLAKQIAGRIKHNLEKDRDLKTNRVEGQFKNGDFLFELEVSNNSGDIFGQLSYEKNKELLKESLGLASTLLRGYDFTDFRAVELRNLTGKEILRIKKEDLLKVRRNKKLIDNYIYLN